MANTSLTQEEQESVASYVAELKRFLAAGAVRVKPMPPIVASICIPETLTPLTGSEQEELRSVIETLEGFLSEARQGRGVELTEQLNISSRVCR